MRDPHALSGREVLATLHSTERGLEDAEVTRRLEEYGPNRLEPPRSPPWWRLVVRQFANPLIHLTAVYLPPIQSILGVSPIHLSQWLLLASIAFVIVMVMELHKLATRRVRRA